MAEVQITLKLNADEFQTLREELADHVERLKNARYNDGGGRIAQPEFGKLTNREARTRFLLERLG